MPENRVTLQNLADHLNLSRSTVSLALRGAGRIAPATRQRVREAAEALGYRPDPLLSAFSRRRQEGSPPGSVLAVVGGKLPVRQAIQHLTDPASRLGYQLEPFVWESFASEAALTRVLAARGIAGVYFPEQSRPLNLDHNLWTPHFRGVYCGPYLEGGEENCPFDVVRHNPFDAMKLAWQKAVERGARRIGFVLPTNGEHMTSLESKAFAAYDFLSDHQPGQHLPRLEPLVARFEELSSDRALLRDWVRDQAPELVIGDSFPVYSFLRNAGFEMPGDVRLIVLRLRRQELAVAGVLVDHQSIGRRALHHLHAIIQHGHEMEPGERSTLVVNAVWRDGATCPPLGQ
jgi:LacI family transcriptional regulator